MHKKLILKPVGTDEMEAYIYTGVKAYSQHYRTYWKEEDPLPYLQSQFSPEVVKKEIADLQQALFLIYKASKLVGILKWKYQKKLDLKPDLHLMYLEKLYLLKEFTGKGIGQIP